MTDLKSDPVLITVAPNGARHSKQDHTGVPLSPDELVTTAIECTNAGAAMIHLHVRDHDGTHSLEPDHYRPAIEKIKNTVGDRLLIQVTSEAAGVYSPNDQIHLISALEPDGVSIAVRELFGEHADIKKSAKFVHQLHASGALVQYILYNPKDVERYCLLKQEGVIPDSRAFVLFVLGRYGSDNTAADALQNYIDALDESTKWMVCAFGQQAYAALNEAVNKGGHVRIGFENGWSLPDGSVADNNASLIEPIAKHISDTGRQVATADDVRGWFE